MIDLIKKLIPKKGFAWRLFPGDLKLLTEGLSEEPKRIKAFINAVVRELNPGTAIDTQEDWYQQYGLIYNNTRSIEEKQAETLERFIALGGQDIVYLQDKLEKAGFVQITLIENKQESIDESNVCGTAKCGAARCFDGSGFGSDWIFYYFVIGTVGDDQELEKLKVLLQKLAPAHLVPDFTVISSDNVCGPAVCGVAICDG